ncbi:MAG: acyl-CoA thioesterase [Limisphaerales bacterium]
MTGPFVHRYRVTYADCTIGNHIYYSRYLDLLELARGEFLRFLGQPLLKWQEEGVAFPVIEARLQYRRGARYDDLLDIEVRLTALKGVRLNFAYTMRDGENRTVLEAETFHACADVSEKPRRLPPSLVNALQPWLNLEESRQAP